jgi:hypothetical protein
MLEYPIEEAKQLLSRNLNNATTNMQSLCEDLDYLKDQITTSEVNIARVHNYKIEQTRKAKAAEKSQ